MEVMKQSNVENIRQEVAKMGEIVTDLSEKDKLKDLLLSITALQRAIFDELGRR